MAKFLDFKYLCKKKFVASEHFRVHHIYLEAQFQIEFRIFRTFTGIDIPGKGKPIALGEEEEDNSF